MNKGKLVELSGIESGKLDYAVPQQWLDQVNALGIKESGLFAWTYHDEKYGRPISNFELLSMGIQKGNVAVMSRKDLLYFLEAAKRGDFEPEHIADIAMRTQ